MLWDSKQQKMGKGSSFRCEDDFIYKIKIFFIIKPCPKITSKVIGGLPGLEALEKYFYEMSSCTEKVLQKFGLSLFT